MVIQLVECLLIGEVQFSLLFIEKRFIPVFYHVLCSFILKLLSNLRPFIAVFFNELYDLEILGNFPFSLFNKIIFMVHPSFTALLWVFEALTCRLKVDEFGNLIPLSFGVFSG